MPAHIRPQSGLRALVSSIRPNRTPVNAFVDAGVTNKKMESRRSSTVGSIGGSVFRRFRRASAPSALETQACPQQNIVEQSDCRSKFASNDQKIHHLLEDIFNSTCELTPPAVAAEVRSCNSSFLRTVFAHLSDACQDCLCVDVQNRMKIMSSLMARWLSDTQKAVAAALLEQTAWEAPRGCRGHNIELVLFALQLKLQAGLRLMNDDYLKNMHQAAQHHEEQTVPQVTPLCKTSHVQTKHAEPSDVESPIARHMDLEGMGIEVSSAINASILRAERNRFVRTGEVEESDSPVAQRFDSAEMKIEASSAINAAIFRAERNRNHGDGSKETENVLYGEPQRYSQDKPIEASSALNASIFRREEKRISRSAKEKMETDLPMSRHIGLQDVGIEASCTLNASIFRAERARLAHRDTADGQNVKPNIVASRAASRNSSANLLSPDFQLRSTAGSKLERCRPACLDDDVCGRDSIRVSCSASTPTFSTS